jgi:photosystem II stability/assembly factor-like uncharacterized protein
MSIKFFRWFAAISLLLGITIMASAQGTWEVIDISGVTAANLSGVNFPTTTEGWAVGAGGVIIHTTDGGATWTTQTSGVATNLTRVAFVSATEGWAVGASGVIIHTTDGGATWTAQTSGVTTQLNGVAFVSATEGWVVGASGVILHTTDGGATWTAQTSGVTTNLTRVTFVSATEGWTVGQSGVILHTTDGGATWTPQTSGITTVLNGVVFVSPTEGWVVGASGVILRTTDGGATWTAQTSGITTFLSGIASATSPVGLELWTVGQSGVILHTTDGGTTWPAQTSGTINNLAEVNYAAGGINLWAVGSVGTLVRYTDTALPVVLSAFNATVSGDVVLLRWKTESEVNNLGFKVYRSTQIDGDYVKVTPTLITGAGTEPTPHEYSFIDEDVVVGNTYYYYLEDVDFSGKTNRSHIIEITVGKQTITRIIPIKSSLFQNYPNPFNPETWLPYQLSRDASVAVRIYNLKGQPIRTISLGQKAAGIYLTKDKAAYWDGRDDSGEKVASGMYFYTLQAGDFKATKRMIIVE